MHRVDRKQVLNTDNSRKIKTSFITEKIVKVKVDKADNSQRTKTQTNESIHEWLHVHWDYINTLYHPPTPTPYHLPTPTL